MASLPAGLLGSCTPRSKCLQDDTMFSACCLHKLSGDPVVDRAVGAEGAQEKLRKHPLSPTKNSLMLPFCCRTPATCDSTPVDAFKNTDEADREARTAQLQCLLDKIDQESYKSIKCLKSTLDEVDRVIHTPSSCPLSRFTWSTPRQNDVCNCRSAAREFFYNRGYHRQYNKRRCSPLTSSSPYTCSVSGPQNTRGGAASVCSAESTSATTSTSGQSATLPHVGSSPVPRKLETVFGGFSSIKRNSRKLYARLQQAKTIVTRVSFEAEVSPNSPSSFAESRDVERHTIRKALCLELLDNLESSVKTAERLNVQVEQLEQKSRRKLNELHEEMVVRQRFKLSPWQRAVTKPSPVLLRALSRLKNVDGVNFSRVKSTSKAPAAGCNAEQFTPSTNTGGPGLSRTSIAFSVAAIDGANWLENSPLLTGGESTEESQNKIRTDSPVNENGRNSYNYKTPETATLRRSLNTLHAEFRGTKLFDAGTFAKKDADGKSTCLKRGGENATWFACHSSEPDNPHATTNYSSTKPSTFTSSWEKKNEAVCSNQRPRRTCVSQTKPQQSHPMSELTNLPSPVCDRVGTTCMLSGTRTPCSTPLRNSHVDGTTAYRTCAVSTWPVRRHPTQASPLSMQARSNADNDHRKPADIVQDLSASPRNTACFRYECGSRFLAPPLSGAWAIRSCHSSHSRHNFAKHLSSPTNEASNRASTAASSVPLPIPVGRSVRDGSDTRQYGSNSTTYERLPDASLSRQFRGSDDRAGRSPFAMNLGFQRHCHGPCDSQLNGDRQGDVHSQTALASVSCRLLPSPSLSAEHSPNHMKNSTDEQPCNMLVQ